MEKINKLLYSAMIIIFITTSANALTVKEILGLDLARLMQEGKTDLEIQLIAKVYYKQLQSQGKSDEEIKQLSDKTYRCEREYKQRMREIIPASAKPQDEN